MLRIIYNIHEHLPYFKKPSNPYAQFLFSSMFIAIVNIGLSGCHIISQHQSSIPYIDPGCPRLPGLGETIPGDLINSKNAANKIADVVFFRIYHGSYRKYSSGIRINDGGRLWNISEMPRHGVYGSDVLFSIDKCTGAIEKFRIEE